MLVSIHQPHYLPWLRYFEKVARSDYFVVLDDVDYTRNGWQNRNKIKTTSGAQTLTVPVSGKLGTPINEVLIASSGWSRKHLASITQNYATAPYLESYRDSFERLLQPEHTPSLSQLSCSMLSWHLEALGLETPWSLASALDVPSQSTGRLIDLVRSVGGTGYLTGEYAFSSYLDASQFERAGIELWVFDWQAPVYRQLHPKIGFLPDLATLDALLCCGGEETLRLLRSASKVRRYRG